MSLTRRFTVQFGGHLLVEGPGRQQQAVADLHPVFSEAIGKSAGGHWRFTHLTDPEEDPRRVDFIGDLLIDAVHADEATDIGYGLLEPGLDAVINAHEGGDWEFTKVIDPEPDTRDTRSVS